MARQFNGTSQALQSAAALDLTSVGTGDLTVAFWLWWDAFANDDDLALEFSANAGSNIGSFLIDPNGSVANAFEFAHAGTGGFRYVHFTRPSAAAWHHYMLVMSTTAAANHVAYVDGSSVSLTVDLNTGGSSWGNYVTYVMSRNAASLWGAGRMAGLGIWAGALTSGNATTLAGGAAPDTVGTPLYAWNLCGASSPEPASVGSTALNITGSAPQVADPAAFAAVCGGGAGRTTKNTRAFPLGMAIGMHLGEPGVCSGPMLRRDSGLLVPERLVA